MTLNRRFHIIYVEIISYALQLRQPYTLLLLLKCILPVNYAPGAVNIFKAVSPRLSPIEKKCPFATLMACIQFNDRS